MKNLYLMFSRITQYYLKNKLIFTLFVLGGIINSIMLIYCYGNLLSIVLSRDSHDLRYRMYEVYFTSNVASGTIENLPTKESIIELSEYVEGKGVLMVMAKLPKEEYVQAGDFATFLFPYHSGHDRLLVEGTAKFTAPDQVLAPSVTELKPGDRVFVLGKSFEVIGLVESAYAGPNYIIPMDTFFDMGALDRVDAVFFITDETQSFIFGTDPYEQIFRSLYQDDASYQTYPSGKIARILIDTIIAMPKVLITYIIAAICYIFMLRYLIDSTMNETIVSMIVGAPKPTLIGSIFWESTVLSLGANTLGILVHIILYQPLFNKLNLHEYVVYKPIDYLNILILMFVTGFVVVIPVVMKYLRLPPLAARRAQT